MVMLDDDKFTQFNLREYENQSLKDRMYGISIDRSVVNSSQMGNLGDINKFAQFSAESVYYMSRSVNPTSVKRLINEDIVDLQQIHKNMTSLLPPILLDIFGSKQPTVYDWVHLNSSDQNYKEKQENTIHDKQTRRVRNNFSNIVTDLDKVFSCIMVDENNKKQFVPKRDVRWSSKKNNKSIKKITTSYSRESINPHFDSSIFIDKNYVKRATKFWKSTLCILNNVLNKIKVKPEKEWLLFHIINNDIGFHVLFDNLSIQGEMKRLKTLNLRTVTKYLTPQFVFYVNPLTDNDIINAIWEWKKFIKEFMNMDYPLLNDYKIKPSIIKKRAYEMILESAESYRKGNDYETSIRILKISDEFYKNYE